MASAAAMSAAISAETDGKGDAKATESGAANLMAETIGDSGSDRQQLQQR